MGRTDFEAEYNNRQRVPEHVAINARWQAQSNAYRASAWAELDQPYGPGERHRYDLFLAGKRPAPLVAYIHGGYWQRGERQGYAFLARGLNVAGLHVALPSYTLCPAASVMEIVAEMRLFLAALWKRTKTYPLVTGHSAGGHLTAAMLGTDWGQVAGVPADLVRAGVAISGLFELVPLIGTSINDLVRLDEKSATSASPRLWPPPPKDRMLVAAVGGEESSEFLRQSRDIAETWARSGLNTEYLVVPGTNHFTVVDTLTDPGSPLFRRVAALAAQVAEEGGVDG